MTERTTLPAAFKPVFHRGRFEMFAMTRAYFREEHGALITTPYAAEIRADDGSVLLLHFTSDVSMAGFVAEMVPTLIEVHRGDGEDIGALVALLQSAWNGARDRAEEIAEAAIARAARQC